MSARRPTWDLPALRRRLDAAWPGVALEIVETTGSTNSDLLERVRGGDAAACVRVAEQQTEGRGRLGRAWVSEAGASLTFSCALPLEVRDWSGLSLAIGVALADTLDVDTTTPAAADIHPGHAAPEAAASGPPRIGVKWPNDLWLVGRKLGGILIESTGTESPRVAVIGVGVNVRALAPREGGASEIAWLAELDDAATAPSVFAVAAPALLGAVREFERGGFAAFAERYARRDLLAGREVRTSLPGAPIGRAEGLTPNGALRVRTADGRLVEIASGEVSVRPSEHAIPPC
jgi:BirA family biotin operon repressor/biotin-[acetyl-CoA-carboxylase] ligase